MDKPISPFPPRASGFEFRVTSFIAFVQRVLYLF